MQSAFELSSSPTRIDVLFSDYSEFNQRMEGEINKELTITYSGTQTFTAQGKPFDSDND